MRQARGLSLDGLSFFETIDGIFLHRLRPVELTAAALVSRQYYSRGSGLWGLVLKP